jgi:hypothetical protein
VVLLSQANGYNVDQPLFTRLRDCGFLPSRYQGVRFRSSGIPVLYLADPAGVDRTTRRRMIDTEAQLNRKSEEAFGDPEIDTRLAQYEMAYRMQTSVLSLVDPKDEPGHTYEM